MKKNIKLFSFLLPWTIVSCVSLKSVPLNDKLTIKVPKDAQEVTLNQLSDKIKNYRKNPLYTEMDKLYAVDSMLLGVKTESWEGNESNRITLEIYKSQVNSTLTMAKYKIDYADIKKVGSDSFLILNYQRNGIGFYSFYTNLDKNVNNVTGVISYDISKQKQSSELLDKVLKNIEIKE